ncbi:hypothetical protein F4819DRAFT_500717 [Hypoxylon fuscum]|nr:hypothetical protein F4819DRAFT_500717 [Hypoxylon fuscum]
MSTKRLSNYHEFGLIQPTQAYYIPPIRDNSISKFDREQVKEDAENTRVIMHDNYMQLVAGFIAHKMQHGTNTEKQIYVAGWTPEKQISRLFTRRAITFSGEADSYTNRLGHPIKTTESRKTWGDFWDRVGTDNESKGLNLGSYLSYDEMLLGSLIGISGPSFFINDGNRKNRAVQGEAGTYETRGIITGLVGPRFQRAGRMDSILIEHAKKNNQHPELTKLFLDFLGVELQPGEDFSVGAYMARMKITFDLLLLEANMQAAEVGKKAYVYLVGLGLGVFKHTKHQATYFTQAFLGALVLLNGKLDSIATVEFGYISGIDAETQTLTTQVATAAGIDIIFNSKREPAAKLPPGKDDQLLVLSYAWNANSFPGNSFWNNNLDGSGDPAAACMSTIAELHNWVMNPHLLDRQKTLG